MRIEGAEAELLVALLRRPGAREVQAAMLAIEHEHTGGALVQCALAPPARSATRASCWTASTAPARRNRSRPASWPRAPSPRRDARSSRRSRSATRPDRRLPIVSRALTGDPAGLPRPVVLAPWEDDDPELTVDAADDEDGFQRVMEMLLAGARTARQSDLSARQRGVAARRLRRLDDAAVEGRLRRRPPRALDTGGSGRVPARLLPAQGLRRRRDARRGARLRARVPGVPATSAAASSGEPLEQLEHACDELRDEFHQRARDSSHWGLAKSMVMQMQAEGVDPSAPGALDAWIADFNARPPEQRDAIIGPAADRMTHAAGLRPAAGTARTQTARPAPQGAAPRASATDDADTLKREGCRPLLALAIDRHSPRCR